MLADRMPLSQESALARPLAWATRLVLRFPLPVIVVAVTLAAFSVLWTYNHLGFRTSRLDLLNPDSGYNKLWIEYINEFGDTDDAVIVVEGTGRDSVVPVLEELSVVLSREDRLFQAVLHEVDLSKIRSKGLHYLPLDELHEVESLLDGVEPILGGQWFHLNLAHAVATINYQLDASSKSRNESGWLSAEAKLAGLMGSLSASLTGQGGYRSPWQRMNHSFATLSQIDSEYLLTNEGRLGFVLLHVVGDNEFARRSKAIQHLRRLIAQVQARYPHARIGLTGLPVIEYDEMQTSQRDMLQAGLVGLVGVACIFIAGLGGLRHPVMTVLALLLAMAWSIGYVTFVIGHLNILSISFGIILIGLGVDFGIHYVARYLHLRKTCASGGEAIVETASSIGPGIVTGGVATAIAFFMAGLTEFTGIAELGVIAGGGILLCICAAMLVLPAMLYFADRNANRQELPDTFQVDRWIAPLLRFPRTMLVIAVIFCLLIALGLPKLRYDHNLLNLQPAGLASVRLERKLLAEANQSIWFALSIAESREELLRRKRQFLQLASVDRTEEIVSLLPADHGEKRSVIARIQRRLEMIPERPPLIPETPPEKLGRELAEAHAQLVRADPSGRATRRQIEQIRDVLRQMAPSACYARLSDFQQRMAGDLLSRLHTLRAMANPEPPKLTDLPRNLVTRFVGKSNRHLLKIYGRGDIWDMAALEKFVADVKHVDPEATGNPLQTYYASRQMQRNYVDAAIYSFVAVVLVLLLDFHRIHYVLLALAPMTLGLVLLFGILGWLDIPLNPANMIVLPLLLGIGINDGVHVVHDFRRQLGRYRISSSTSAAVLLTSLITMVGFGSLMLASHQGLKSLGLVLTIGVCCCLVTSLLLLPAGLSWMARGRGLDSSTHPIPEASEVLEIGHTEVVFHPPGAGGMVPHPPQDRSGRGRADVASG